MKGKIKVRVSIARKPLKRRAVCRHTATRLYGNQTHAFLDHGEGAQ